ncbi:thermonuclease family protein [Micrococcus endophyticus]|uniref:thermonuclease family protein n=1 Tax=Micrococcus endophyticus TaxID=455343 RepID=UPI0034CDE5F8
MPLPRLCAALGVITLSALLLTGCVATDDDVAPAPASGTATSALGASVPGASASTDGASASAASSSPVAVPTVEEEASSPAPPPPSAREEATSPTPAAPEAATEGDVVTVESIVDGDTIRVTLDEVSTPVRLLNIDTPETRHPSRPVECQGPEATAALKSMIRPGDTVVLQYDDVLLDRYDRLLAAVFADGRLVNAEMARLGLGEPVVFDGNVRFLPEVEAAWEQARADGVGLFSGECAVEEAPEPVEDEAPTAVAEPAPAPAAGSGPVPGADFVCPDDFPVKGNDNSFIYHVPGQQHYGRTNARNCYASAAAAEVDGYRAAKR